VERRPLAPGRDLYVMPAPRFAGGLVVLAFRLVLAEERVTRGALLPRVLRRGTRRRPDMRALAGRLDDLYGASLGADSVKMGDQQVIELSFSHAGDAALSRAGLPPDGSLPSEGAALLTEMLLTPAGDGPTPGLNPVYFREEKEVLAREIAALADDRMAYAHHRLIEEMCRGQPYSLHALGRAEDLDRIGPADLDGFRREILAGAPLAAYLIGPFDDRAATRVEELLRVFAAGPGGRRTPLPRPLAQPPPEREREVIEEADVEQARLVVGLRTGVLRGDEDHPAQVFYNGLLGGFVHSRLFRRIREEAGLAYYAFSRLVATKGIILISCGIQARNYGRALELIRAELNSLARGDFTAAEFEATRNSLLASARGKLDSPGALVYGHLERLAAGQEPDELAPWRGLDRVTPDEVRSFACRPVVDTVYLLARRRPAGA